MNQEQLFKLQMIEQEANQINQQLEVVEQNIIELNELKDSLDEINKKDSKEFLANLGKKIFIPVDIREKKLIVDVGDKNFIKKSIPETKEIIKDQIDKLEILKMQFSERVESLQMEMQNIIMEISKNKCSHDNCSCEEECEDCKCE